jgi:hypothetical protein
MTLCQGEICRKSCCLRFVNALLIFDAAMTPELTSYKPSFTVLAKQAILEGLLQRVMLDALFDESQLE